MSCTPKLGTTRNRGGGTDYGEGVILFGAMRACGAHRALRNNKHNKSNTALVGDCVEANRPSKVVTHMCHHFAWPIPSREHTLASHSVFGPLARSMVLEVCYFIRSREHTLASYSVFGAVARSMVLEVWAIVESCLDHCWIIVP